MSMVLHRCQTKVARDKGISETKLKQQSPFSNSMHHPMMSWGNACSTCIHKSVRFKHQPVMSQADACTYCMGSVVLILSGIYLFSSYFDVKLEYQSKVCPNGTAHFQKCQQLFEYQHLLLLRDIWW